ncbi:hypothetical protein ONZ45_g317 [Pleurotus djamor]|nr:hypothetical protein ONZ45_g317 [Pleurotus djamor]
MEAAVRVHDPDFYIDDGNVFLLVESTIFKVHRTMLMKDNSIFHLMFTASNVHDDCKTDFTEDSSQLLTDVVDIDCEGESELTPICLPDVTVDEFRTLLWSLYALPAELVTASRTRAEVDRFIDLAMVSSRFQFPDCEASILARLTAVAVLCDHQALSSIVVAHWKRLVGEGRELKLALEVAERHSMDELLGLGYLAFLRKGRDHWPSESRHTIRLLNGFYILVNLCITLPRQSPPFTHHITCSSQNKCGENWRKFWKHIISGDVSGKLAKTASLWRYDLPGLLMIAQSVVQAVVEETIPEHGLAYMPKDCRMRALEATKARVKEEQSQLRSYFHDL